MIELKQNNIWSDSLNSFLNFNEPWNYIDRELHKFICFAGAGGGPGGGGGGGGAAGFDPFSGFDVDLSLTPAPPGDPFGNPADDTFDEPDPLAELDPTEIDPFGQDPFGGLSVGHLGQGLAGIPSGRPRGPGDLALNDTEFLGFTTNRFGELVDFSLPEFAIDVVEAVAPFGALIGTAARGVASLVDQDNPISAFNLGLNTANPIEQVSGVLGFVSPDIQTTLDTFSDRATQAIFGGNTNNISGSVSTDTIDDPIPSTSFTSPSTPVNNFDTSFGDATPIVDIIENPLEVKPKEEAQPSSRFGRFIRRPFNFTPGRIFAKEGGLISLMDDGGPIPERFTRADGRPFRPRFGEPGYNEKGVVTHAQQAYMDWLKAHGGPSALSKEGLRRGRIDEIDYGGEVGKVYFQYDPGDSSYSEVYGASMYDDDGDIAMFPFAYPEHPDFRLLNALGGGPQNLPQSVNNQNTVDIIRKSIIARRRNEDEEKRNQGIVSAVGAYTGGGIQKIVNQEPTLLDVVNKGMSIPEETIPSQRPEQFIKGQQQPGGLRSTNYYTNSMQPASFYAQPQQVRNYGSIY